MPQATQAPVSRPVNLALIFQEVLTATVRLRANRQAVNDAESFRHHIREALRTAAQEARTSGYATDDIKMGTFAVVGFLDESVLSTSNPMFAAWPRQTLQQELFGTQLAGEIFFQNLQQLLGRPDSVDLADLLEVHYLCLLLGYRGRYSTAVGASGELQSAMQAIADKIRRIRGPLAGLSPSWQLQAESVAPPRDRVTRIFAIIAICCVSIAVVLFVAYKVSLSSGAGSVASVAAPVRN
jgi:type VI secretion system protein ImpK